MDRSEAEVKYSTCYFCTSRGCAMRVYVEAGRVQKVKVDTGAPVVPGCLLYPPDPGQGVSGASLPADLPPEAPLRTGGRPVAADFLGAGPRRDRGEARVESGRACGPEALATSSGTGRGGWDFAKTRFMNLFGSPNRFGAVTVCYGPRSMVSFATFGGAIMPDRKRGKTRLSVLWGRNPHEGGPHTWHSFQKAIREDIRTMVVDPR